MYQAAVGVTVGRPEYAKPRKVGLKNAKTGLFQPGTVIHTEVFVCLFTVKVLAALCCCIRTVLHPKLVSRGRLV